MKVKAWTVAALSLLVVVGIGMGLSSAWAAEPAAPAAEPAAPAAEPAAPAAEPAAPAAEPAAPAPAEPGAAEAPAAPKGKKGAGSTSVLDTINKGGLIGYLIIVLSFVALSLIIEHAVSIRREKLCPTDLANELQDYFNEEQYEEALELCNVERNLLTDIVRAGLSRIDAGYERMQEAMQEAGEEASVALQQKISYLSLIANISPMLGLLGTVNGMVGAFAKIAVMTVVKPAVLAANINEALVTTLLGLTVAIPVMCAYQFFSNRVTRIVLESTTVISDLMERFKPAKKERPRSAGARPRSPPPTSLPSRRPPPMKVSTKRKTAVTELNMTPMIDVVFLLITFFMVVTEITRQDEIEDLVLPDVQASKPDDNPDPSRLVINITRNGTIYVGGSARSDKWVFDALAVEARLGRSLGSKVSDRVVLVKADEGVEFKHIRKIMAWCVQRDIGIWRLAFGTLPFEARATAPE